MLGKCKACPCKDAHISSLKEEIDNLRRLAMPPMQVLPSEEQSGVDALLSGNHEMPQDQATRDAQEAMLAETDRMFAGTYDNY